jgi:hypothetical protein
MAKWIAWLLLAFTDFCAWSQNGNVHCIALEIRQNNLKKYPELATSRQLLEKFTNYFTIQYPHNIRERSVLTIPVVVHIIWNKNEENISDEQILSQIAVLNKDFRKKNSEASSVPAIFKDFAADVEIEFCLALRDPAGNPTKGITRTWTPNSAGIGGSKTIFYSTQGGKDAWNTKKYLNIYVAKFAGAISGFATFPESGPPAEDGVVINYLNFGTQNTNPPYNLGRTLTHEIGHYLNLEHPWGPKINDCCADDFVNDTPPSCETYLNMCPTHPVMSCNSTDMFMNFMFYTNDACMAMFTNGQKLRMLATLLGARKELLSSEGCQPVDAEDEILESKLTVYPNPAGDRIWINLNIQKDNQVKASVVNVWGMVLLSSLQVSGSDSSVNISELSPGIYFLQLEYGDRRFVKRFAKL